MNIHELSNGTMTDMSQTHLLQLPPAIRSASEVQLDRYGNYESGDLHTSSTLGSDTSDVKKKKKFNIKRYFLKKIKYKSESKKGI